MFVSKKEYESLKKKIEEQERILNNMAQHLIHLQQEVNELNKPKEPGYLA